MLEVTIQACLNPCNQKSSRDPVLELDEATVQNTIDDLKKKCYVNEKSGFGSRVTKYQHRFCNTEFGTLKFIIVPDDVTRMAMLETGELDLISDIPPHHLKRLEKNKKLVIRRASTAPSLFALSSKPDNYPIFKDPKFALSFSYAINRQEIGDLYYSGLTDVARVSAGGVDPVELKLDRRYRVRVPVSVPAGGMSWFLIE